MPQIVIAGMRSTSAVSNRIVPDFNAGSGTRVAGGFGRTKRKKSPGIRRARGGLHGLIGYGKP
jgi:hypothetical protein